MPRRSDLPDRLRLEDALEPSDLVALREQCSTFDVPRERWHRVPALARVWETVAARRMADRIEATTDASADKALHLASKRLGLSPDTVHSRLRRWFRDAYGGA